MQLLRRIFARVLAWRAARRGLGESPLGFILPAAPQLPIIHRDVSSSGVRVYSLCGCCGARLEASATLCDECAQRRSRLM
ncbi:MAG TPA: hypothetical protein VJU87_00170 [Gemmatimonadaceae bacterium]|nr:hypothetical protein [Gemmatimonadaceae bacterium]